jgi:hypothetical protein
MSEIYSIRLSLEEKENLQEKSEKFGFKTSSDFARELIKRGLLSFNMTEKEEHIISNSAQSVMLLREVVSLMSGNDTQSTQVIKDVKNSAEEWTNKFKQKLQGRQYTP